MLALALSMNAASQRRWPDEMLYDLAFDPHEACNLAADPDCAAPLAELRGALQAWMAEQADPLLHGIPPPPLAVR